MPRNVQPATERDGLVTPINVPKGSLTVNDLSTDALLLAVDENLVPWTRTSIDTLDQLAELLTTIQQIAEARAQSNLSMQLGRIRRLAAMGSRLAAETCNEVDCGRERFDDVASLYRAGGAA